MRPQGIIVRFDIQENIRLRLLAGSIMPQVNPFTFQAAEKAFGSCIIIRIALPGHALEHMQLFQMLPVIGRSILDAPVAMENKPF